MNLFTIIQFLFFDRKAIEKIGACRSSIRVGIALTLLAAIARDYDGAYLLAQPYFLLVPLAASGAMATVTFLYLRLFRSQTQIPYKQFLTYFWLMAPLAFGYAIPVERLMTPGGAAAANLWLLALVAVWRVLLLTRVVSVCEKASFLATLCKILFIADCVVLLVLFLTPLPMFNIMGGIHLSERDQMIAGLVVVTRLLGLLLLFVLLLVNLSLLASSWLDVKPLSESDFESKPSESTLSALHASVAPVVWIGIAIFFFIGIGLLNWAQPEQARRYRAEQLLKSGSLAEGLSFISKFNPSDFPPHWSPPPSLAWHEKVPDPIQLVTEAIKPGYAPWVQQLAIDRFSEYVGINPYTNRWDLLDKQELQQAMSILETKFQFHPRVLEIAHKKITRMAYEDGYFSDGDFVEPWKRDLAIDYLKRNDLPLPPRFSQ